MKHQLSIQTRVWPLSEPFVISRSSQTTCEVIVVQLAVDGHVGRGEAVGVSYHGETIDSMRAQIERVRGMIEDGVDRGQLLDILPPGGARNALDAALWDLEAKRTGEGSSLDKPHRHHVAELEALAAGGPQEPM